MNVDEWSFDRLAKHSYSWLPAGVSSSIVHYPINGKWSPILSTFSNDEWFSFIKKDIINSKVSVICESIGKSDTSISKSE